MGSTAKKIYKNQDKQVLINTKYMKTAFLCEKIYLFCLRPFRRFFKDIKLHPVIKYKQTGAAFKVKVWWYNVEFIKN